MIKQARHSGMDCRNPEHMDVGAVLHPASWTPANPAGVTNHFDLTWLTTILLDSITRLDLALAGQCG